MDDANLLSSERLALLRELDGILGDVSPSFWASCQLCDIDSLHAWTRMNFPLFPDIIYVKHMIMYWTKITERARAVNPRIQASFIKDQHLYREPLMPELMGFKTSGELATDRDGCRCVLTGEPAINAAFIYPRAALAKQVVENEAEQETMWNYLRLFFPSEKIHDWRAELFSNGRESMGAFNLITLSANMHEYWNRGAFALKPVSINVDRTVLVVQFFWQKQQVAADVLINLLTLPFSTQDLNQNTDAYEHGPVEAYDFRNKRQIVSGDIFELTTDDPIERPLPSASLLELRWFMQRIVGMVGAIDLFKGTPPSSVTSEEALDR